MSNVMSMFVVCQCVNVLPSFENACSGSHEALVIGYPCHLTKY